MEQRQNPGLLLGFCFVMLYNKKKKLEVSL